MEPTPEGLADTDGELWTAAVDLLAKRYRHERHEVAAVVRSRSGALHLGVHMAGSAGRSSICAEGMALGAALTEGDLEIDTVLAVLYRPAGTIRPIAPCGVCRELLVDYCPDAWIYLCTDIPPTQAGAAHDADGFPRPARTTGTAVRTRVRDLMPGKNPRSW
jgi:cytidine deaminase